MKYRIGELAAECNINKETIRYYERKGLIKETSRTDSGYRMYSEETVKRIGFIKRMQQLGFSLSEIHKLLGVVDKDEVRCANMYNFISQKIVEVQQRMKDLKRIENMLIELKKRCPNEEKLHECPIIETLIDNERKEISMKNKKTFITGANGTLVTVLCCAAPSLSVLLGSIGLGSITGY